MSKKKDKQLKEELFEGIDHIRRQSYINGAKDAITALTAALQKSTKEDFRKEHLLILVSEVSRIFDDEEFLKSVLERNN